MTQIHTARKPAFALLFAGATLLSGCATQPTAPNLTGSISSPQSGGGPRSVAANPDAQPPLRQQPKQSALVDTTTQLAAAFRKDPANGDVAIQYIYSLRRLGLQQQAVGVLGEAYRANPDHPEVASEYGRLLVGSGKDTQAQRVLERANAASEKDWRTLSALGTVEARAGNYAKATEYFRKANDLEPKRISIINNLALAIALSGQPAEAENLLRNADDSGNFGPRLRQNLALVLALQGKFDDAQSVATTDLSPKEAAANIAYLKRMLHTTELENGVEFTDESIATSELAKTGAPARITTPALTEEPAPAEPPAAIAAAAQATKQKPFADDAPELTGSLPTTRSTAPRSATVRGAH